MGLWSRKPIESLVEAGDAHGMRRHLGLVDLTLLGVGGTIGAGIFVLTGTAAAQYAGPAVAIAFVVAAIGCLCAALCYAELASMIPVTGSAYTYAYAALGEFVAWLIGWNLILECLFACSTVAVGWSGYLVSGLADVGVVLPAALTTPTLSLDAAGHFGVNGAVNLPAALIILALAAVLYRGVKGSAWVNAVMVLIKLVVILLVIGFGALHVDPANWRPFIPENTGTFGEFGWSGIVRAAGIAFFAYIGFDMVSTSAQEAKRPERAVPLALMLSLGICTALYIGMALVMTGLAPYTQLNVPDPVFVAIDRAGAALAWLKPLVSIGVIIGLCSAMLLTQYGQTRIFYAMGRDGLLPPIFARLHQRFRTPDFSTVFVGLAAAVIAAIAPIQLLGELVAIGTLLAFSIVCVGVLVLRVRHPEGKRPFRAPYLWIAGPLGIATCLYMMASLPGATWIRLGVWLALGLAVYAFYGARHSALRRQPTTDAP